MIPRLTTRFGSSRATPCRLGERITKSNRPQIHGLVMRTSAQGWMECYSAPLSHSHSNPTPNHKDLSSRGETRDWGLKLGFERVFSSKICQRDLFGRRGMAFYTSAQNLTVVPQNLGTSANFLGSYTPRNFRASAWNFRAPKVPRNYPKLLGQPELQKSSNHQFGSSWFLSLLGCL